MRIAGEAVLRAPVERVWDALLDPAVLVRTIPGCERLEETGENRYDMTVTAGVAAIRGTYAGTCELRDLHPHDRLLLAVQGAGAPGTISADATAGTGTFASAGAGDGADRAMPGVYVDAPRSGSQNDFLRGIAVGAGLV